MAKKTACQTNLVSRISYLQVNSGKVSNLKVVFEVNLVLNADLKAPIMARNYGDGG